MRVLVFMTQFYHLNGAERLDYELAVNLNRCGIPTDILCMYKENLPGVNEAKQKLINEGIPNIHFLNLPAHPPILSLLPAIIKLRRLIKKYKYKIIETSWISPSVIASWATIAGSCRHVSGIHHVYKRNVDDKLNHKLWRLSLLCNKTNRYYAISEYVAKSWIIYSKTPQKRTKLIYNGISNEWFNYDIAASRECVIKELKIPSNAKLILYAGRLAAFKGIDILFKAVIPLLQMENLFLCYIGEEDKNITGTGKILDEMKNYISEENLGKRIRFLGYRKDVGKLMAAADILVHPTFSEGFGLVLVEAMAVGLQVISTEVDGIPEVLASTDSLMVPAGDINALRKAVIEVLNRSPEQIAIAKEKGRTRAEKFKAQKRTEEIIEYFKMIER